MPGVGIVVEYGVDGRKIGAEGATVALPRQR
jgi:hypothetical protein